MVRWHETLAARFGLRIGGLAVLSAAWLAASTLHAQVHSHPPAAEGWYDLGLCTLLVVLAVVGSALLIVGPGLWKRVEIPSQWSAALVEPRQFDVLLYGDPVTPEGLSEGRREGAIRGDAASVPIRNVGSGAVGLSRP